MLAYIDVPLEFRRFGINPFPPEVGREVHAALLELVAAGPHPAGGRPAHRAWTRSRPRSRTTRHRRTSGRTVVDLSLG